MSRSTEYLRTRSRVPALFVALALALTPALVATAPAAAADPWQLQGEIADWDASLVGTEVTVVRDDGSIRGDDAHVFTLTEAVFDETVTGDSGDSYTLYFDVPDDAEFIDGYLGAKLDDEFDDVTWFLGDDALDPIDLIPAAYISGTVTDGTDPIEDADLYADVREIFEDGDWMDYPFTAVTNADGEYVIKVAAGRQYAVTAGAVGYIAQQYDGHAACSCEADFVPKAGSDAYPATGIDFELERLLPPSAFLVGIVLTGDLEDYADPISDDIQVHVYQPVAGGWTPYRTVTTDGSVWFVEAQAGVHRLRFSFEGEWLLIHQVVQSSPDSTPPPDVETIDACFVDTAALVASDDYLVITSLGEGDCGPEPDPSAGPGPDPAPGPSAGPPSRGRTSPVTSTTGVAPVVAPTPTASPTPTATPSPSSSPTPEAVPETPDEPASGPDLFWIVWVGLALLVILVVGGVILVLRRR